MSIQHKRKESLYFKAVAEIIHDKVTNSNVSDVTVTDVSLSNDGSVLKVFVTFSNNKDKSLEGLNNAKGFIRSELAKYGNQRIVPSLVFKYDNTADTATRIDEILASIKKEKK